MRFGFEREFLLISNKKEGGVIFPTDLEVSYRLPLDGDGLHIEARGEPDKDPFQAYGNLVGKETELQAQVRALGTLHAIDWHKLEPGLARKMRRVGKGALREFSITGEIKPPRTGWSAGGLHIHFGVDASVDHSCRCGRINKVQYTPIFNIPKIVNAFDKRFAKEIAAAKRQPGRYEIKVHGFEYRSLPTSIDPLEVAEWMFKNKEIFS